MAKWCEKVVKCAFLAQIFAGSPPYHARIIQTTPETDSGPEKTPFPQFLVHGTTFSGLDVDFSRNFGPRSPILTVAQSKFFWRKLVVAPGILVVFPNEDHQLL